MTWLTWLVLVASAIAAPTPSDPPASWDDDLQVALILADTWETRRTLLDAKLRRRIRSTAHREALKTARALVDVLAERGTHDPNVIARWLMAALSKDSGIHAQAAAAVADPIRLKRPAPSSREAFARAERSRSLEVRIDNGLKIAVVGNPQLERVAIVQRVGLGAAHEKEGEEGYAHLVEHLMFGDGFWRGVESLAGEANAFTSHDATTYETVVPPEALLPILDLEAARFAKRTLDPDDVARELAVVADEIRFRSTLEPIARLVADFRSVALGDHPYGHSVGGTEASLAEADIQGLQDFMARAHTGKNLSVVVVGPFEPRPVKEAIEARYGSLPAGRGQSPLPAPEPSDDDLSVFSDDLQGPRYVGNAWPLPPSRSCKGNLPPCSDTWVADRVALGLLASVGEQHLTRQLSARSRMFTPVATVTVGGDQGGVVAVMSERTSPVGVALSNTGTALLSLLGQSPQGRWRSNPSPKRIREILSQNLHEWLDDEAIEKARASLLRDAYAGAWDPRRRALEISHRIGLGRGVRDSLLRHLKKVSATDVRDAYRRIFRSEGVAIRVR